MIEHDLPPTPRPVTSFGPPRDQGCTLPPKGWVCTRKPGHTGPCAAWPDTLLDPRDIQAMHRRWVGERWRSGLILLGLLFIWVVTGAILAGLIP